MIRYAITHLSTSTGLRTLTFANQGRNFYISRDVAQEELELYRPVLVKVLGDAVSTLEVRTVECYDNGDAKSIYFDLDQIELF